MFNFSIIGGTNVHGKFKPEQKNTYTTLIGDHKIDLREAELPKDTPIKITMCKLIGNAKVIVPPSTRIDVGGVVLIGNKKTSVDPVVEQSGAYVKVSHNCLIGNLEVTSKD
jgi:predicted membrane protein